MSVNYIFQVRHPPQLRLSVEGTHLTGTKEPMLSSTDKAKLNLSWKMSEKAASPHWLHLCWTPLCSRYYVTKLHEGQKKSKSVQAEAIRHSELRPWVTAPLVQRWCSLCFRAVKHRRNVTELTAKQPWEAILPFPQTKKKPQDLERETSQWSPG